MRLKGLPHVGDGAPGREQRLAELAGRQHGVVSIRQLIGPIGYSRRSVSRAAASGRLHRLHSGVYAVGHTCLSNRGEAMAAVLACGPGALLSHYSAAWMWGIAKVPAAPFHVTGPVARRRRLPIRIHRSRCLTDRDRAHREGVPVTALPRTVLDMAALVEFGWLQRMLERSEEMDLFDLGAFEELIDRTRGHHGWGRMRRAIAFHNPVVPWTRSEFERHFCAAVLKAGLPRPSMNYFESGFELDAYWPEARFAVELDAYATHGSRTAFERDRLRQEDLKLHGIEMTRVTDVRFAREPGSVLDRIRRLLSQRGVVVK